jgi:hypothetical protein
MVILRSASQCSVTSPLPGCLPGRALFPLAFSPLSKDFREVCVALMSRELAGRCDRDIIQLCSWRRGSLLVGSPAAR